MRTIPLYMDVHERLPGGTTAEDVAAILRADPELGRRHGVRFLGRAGA